MRKTLFRLIAGLSLLAALVSCGSVGPEKVSALVTLDGKAAGLIVKYATAIDKNSVGVDTYAVDGQKVSTVFASDVNPFDKNDAPAVRQDSRTDGGRYVVVLLKDDGSVPQGSVDVSTVDILNIPKVDVSIRQVKDIKTPEGQVIKAWKKPVKASESFPVRGGLRK